MPHAHTANEFRVVLSSEEDQCDYICASVLDVSPHTPHAHTTLPTHLGMEESLTGRQWVFIARLL